MGECPPKLQKQEETATTVKIFDEEVIQKHKRQLSQQYRKKFPSGGVVGFGIVRSAEGPTAISVQVQSNQQDFEAIKEALKEYPITLQFNYIGKVRLIP